MQLPQEWAIAVPGGYPGIGSHPCSLWGSRGWICAGGRGERPEPCTHTLQQLFLIWNTFSIKDTPSVQLTNGYTGILETAEFYTHDCTGHQWLGSLECSIDFQNTVCLLQKMALESFLPLQGQSSLCCRQTLGDSNHCPSPCPWKGATVKLRGDRSDCTAGTGGTAGEGPGTRHAARTLCTGEDYTGTGMQTELHLGPVTTSPARVTAGQVTPPETGEPTLAPARLRNTQNWKEKHLFSHVYEQ